MNEGKRERRGNGNGRRGRRRSNHYPIHHLGREHWNHQTSYRCRRRTSHCLRHLLIVDVIVDVIEDLSSNVSDSWSDNV